MSAAIAIRNDYTASALRRLAAKSKDANQSRRLLSLAAVCDGMDRSEAAKIGGMRSRIESGSKRCGTGRTASTPTARTACSTARAQAASRG